MRLIATAIVAAGLCIASAIADAAPAALLNPQPSTSTTTGNPQPSTLDPDSRVSVHDFGRPGSVLARDVRGRPEGRPSPRQGPDTR